MVMLIMPIENNKYYKLETHITPYILIGKCITADINYGIDFAPSVIISKDQNKYEKWDASSSMTIFYHQIENYKEISYKEFLEETFVASV